MDKKREIITKDDIVAKASDFVIEYKDVAMFSQNYKLDAHVLGEGNHSSLFIFSPELAHFECVHRFEIGLFSTSHPNHQPL